MLCVYSKGPISHTHLFHRIPWKVSIFNEWQKKVFERDGVFGTMTKL